MYSVTGTQFQFFDHTQHYISRYLVTDDIAQSIRHTMIANACFFSLLILTLFLSTSPVSARGFLHADGREIVDGAGQKYMIRAMGIGGWMVMEPYMFQLNQSKGEGQHKILSDIEALIGSERTQEFHQKWLDNFFTEADVMELKHSGFNTIRIPMHYNLFTLPIEDEPREGYDTWLDRGFEMADSLVLWGERHEVYIILDMHAAPGAQGYDGNINDYDPSKPSLWESDENKRKLIALWVKIAKRYADAEWVGGYDPLNEPNWAFDGDNKNGCNDQFNTPLKDMYAELIPAIRAVDPNHMVILSGNCWGGNYNGIFPLPFEDTNTVISFHKYWNDNNFESISGYVGMRDIYNMPLWMSESGENSNEWFYDAVTLLEDTNIGWAWWTWKKLEAGMYEIQKPSGYDELRGYWDYVTDNPGATVSNKPDADQAYETLLEFADNVRLAKTVRNNGSIDALTQGHLKCETQNPYYSHDRIEAVAYCDGGGLEPEQDLDERFLNNVSSGDWFAQKIYLPETKEWSLFLDVITTDIGTISIDLYGGGDQLGTFEIPNTHGERQVVRIEAPLKAGLHIYGFSFDHPEMDLYAMTVSPDTTLEVESSDSQESSEEDVSSSDGVSSSRESEGDDWSRDDVNLFPPDVESSNSENESSENEVSPLYGGSTQYASITSSFNIYQIDGTLIQSINHGTNNTFDMTDLPQGVYVIQFGKKRDVIAIP